MSRPKPTSILSMDIGSKRIGLAGCDPLGITVTELVPIHRTIFIEELEIIKNYCFSRAIKGLVFGLPLDEMGRLTTQALYCQNYGIKIAKKLALPLAWVNEHSSSWEAGQKYNLQNDRSGKLDSAAAALLLEQWLREGPDLQEIGSSHFS
ncbi:Holliday junction resolvase RuvX [Prochlorococcus marinus]|uniref:Holliday junction resolvase RuvX n=1 Tax=Prochlorococcus marinus TaxID=1219 RepID=UPI0022B5D9A4|nr:Holliday junction resolvase RuvX [Prochlorococcus marinus]